MNIIIALDVATHHTGYAIRAGDDIITAGTMELEEGSFSGNKIAKDISKINTKITQIVWPFKNMKIDKITVIIENSNYGIKSVAYKLSFYSGIFVFSLLDTLRLAQPTAKITLKIINSREWQLRAFGEVLDRDAGKAKSIERAKKYLDALDIKNLTDDTADAVNIATLGEIVRDNGIIAQERKKRAQTVKDNTQKILALKIKINDLLTLLINKANKKAQSETQKKKYQNSNEWYQVRPLIEYANKRERERLIKYEAEALELKADIQEIKKFYIKGVIQDE